MSDTIRPGGQGPWEHDRRGPCRRVGPRVKKSTDGQELLHLYVCLRCARLTANRQRVCTACLRK